MRCVDLDLRRCALAPILNAFLPARSSLFVTNCFVSESCSKGGREAVV